MEAKEFEVNIGREIYSINRKKIKKIKILDQEHADYLKLCQDEMGIIYLEDNPNIFLIYNIRNGMSRGLKPSNQNLDYWFNSGYKYICHNSKKAITLSKIDIGKTLEHACYKPNINTP